MGGKWEFLILFPLHPPHNPVIPLTGFVREIYGGFLFRVFA
jgi:hypothetical protein